MQYDFIYLYLYFTSAFISCFDYWESTNVQLFHLTSHTVTTGQISNAITITKGIKLAAKKPIPVTANTGFLQVRVWVASKCFQVICANPYYHGTIYYFAAVFVFQALHPTDSHLFCTITHY